MAAHPRLLLLQARREDDPEREAERRLFARRLDLPDEQVVGHNLIVGLPDLRALERFDALLIGGSGEFYVSDGQFPRQQEVMDLLREVAEGPVPLFGSCFGFHLLTEALGGEIVHDPDNMELGTYELELTAAGRRDELFGSLPDRFLAQVGRKDRAASLPPSTTNFASSERCPHQGFRYRDRPLWATQFHPELDAEDNRRRYLAYLEGYAGLLSDEERRQVMERFQSSPHTVRLLRRFLDLVLG